MSIDKSVKIYYKGKEKNKVKPKEKMWDLERFLFYLFFIEGEKK